MPPLPDFLWTWLEAGRWIGPTTRALTAAGLVGLALVASRLVVRGLRRLRDRSSVGRPLIYVAEKLAGYALILVGVLMGLSTLGINLSSLAVFAGALGVGAGLGLQGVVREFVSGLVAIFDPFVNVGDFIELENGVRGEVAEVGARATRIKTNDGVNIIIPNSKLVENQIANWTLKGGLRRIHIPFGVAYDADRAVVRDVVLKAARAAPFTMPDTETRKTNVWLTGFGDSALNFELVVWPTPEAVRRPSAMHAAYTWAIDEALREAGVEIPYPQMDLRLRALFKQEGEEALATLGLRSTPGAARASASSAPNDAAEAVMSADDGDAPLEPGDGASTAR